MHAVKADEVRERRALGDEGVLRRLKILVPKCDAAQQDLVVAHRQVLARDLVEPGESGLGAGVQALGARRLRSDRPADHLGLWLEG